MRVRDVLGDTPSLSFEFFAPREEAGVRRLFGTIEILRRFEPNFVSVTYGAGGSTRTATAEIVERLQKQEGLCAVAHLTCVGASRGELVAIARDLQARGIENVLALRGDPPKGEATFRVAQGGLSYASELLRLLREEADFCLGGACYPEKHPEAESLDLDLARLAEKVEAGAEYLITQLFFDVSDYVSFVERARRFGIHVPIVPGVLPATDLDALLSMAKKCGASVPAELHQELAALSGDARFERGVELTLELCRALLAYGVPGLHFYTRNRGEVAHVLEALDWGHPARRSSSVQLLNAKTEATTRYGLTGFG
ncbi:MAG: methylenetetrahydrofolate reductase [NAD(P)H] [Myxococcota bacterium]